jgi:twitching motility two-component system response regulator PilH
MYAHEIEGTTMPVSKVLVVDDSPVDLEHLKSIVAGAGYQVITASNGREAQERARSDRPDAILMDVVMDGMDGFEACRNITNDQSTAHIPVFFVTSKNQKADRVWGELQGGRGMITKPYTAEEILRAIQMV